MTGKTLFLTANEAARQLGVSAKALRIYEERGLITSVRTAAGWRTYGPDEMARGREIAVLRALDLSLAQVGEVLNGDVACLEASLAAHQNGLEKRMSQLTEVIERVQSMRQRLAEGHPLVAHDLAEVVAPVAPPELTVALPWPWDGEIFELSRIRPITYITGPLASGKTRLARLIAATVPDAQFMAVDDLEERISGLRETLRADARLAAKVEAALEWLLGEGATASDALEAMLAALYADGPTTLVIDMIEQGIDHASQEALRSFLQRRWRNEKVLFVLTRSSVILDLENMAADEAIVFCPANHSPPMHVIPVPGSPGYEAVATCLATPEVRERSAGVVAIHKETG